MKPTCILLGALAMLVSLPSARGQDATKVEKGQEMVLKDKKGHDVATFEPQPQETALKVQVVISEFAGTQRISSLPYTLNVLGTERHNGHEAHLRYGVRVPISTGSYGSAPGGPAPIPQITYQDVGTNIDCAATQRDDGEYRLDLQVERSSVSMPGSKGNESDWKPGDNTPSPQPLIRSFRDQFTVIAKNGQTIEGTSAVDPVTGHVLKIDITLNVLK